MSIQEQLLKLGITEYHIDAKGQITVYQNIDWSNQNLTNIPIKIYQIWGNVDFSNNLLESLENAPVYIWGEFNCSSNKLKDFKNGPFFVQKRINCENNDSLVSMDYWPMNGLQSHYSIIHKSFGIDQIVIYDYCIKNFFWKPEFTFIENIEMLLKYKPDSIKELESYLSRIPNLNKQSFRGAVKGNQLGII